MIRTKKGIVSKRIDASPSENSGAEIMEVWFVVLVMVLELVLVVLEVVVWVDVVLRGV